LSEPSPAGDEAPAGARKGPAALSVVHTPTAAQFRALLFAPCHTPKHFPDPLRIFRVEKWEMHSSADFSVRVTPKLTTHEASAHLKIAASTLCKMRLSGEGPPFLKIGPRRVVYDLADLEEWASARRRRSTSDTGASS
jgi:hypothetical protein